jgi:gliding motility-associated-like protein
MPAASICSGTALNYAITSDVPGANFTWSRAAVAGISNPAVVNQAGALINETLINTGTTAVNVTYVITPTANSCTGAPFNYVVTVNPSPTITSAAAIPVCSGTPLNYGITFSNSAGVSFTWSRAAVAGISNTAISGQASGTIGESLFNTTSAPVDVTYVITYQTGSCSPSTFNLVVTVSPLVLITSASSGNACTGVPQNYSITTNAAGASVVWYRNAVAGISNPAVNNQTSSTITETLINTTASPVMVTYVLHPMINGCPGTVFGYQVTVNPVVPTPVANANSPVCSGNAINLQSPIIPNAIYHWSGPNGFTSNDQNPIIDKATTADSGTYSLYITINGCASDTVTTDVVVDPFPVAFAGSDTTVCTNATSVAILGTVTSASKTGIWATLGTGSFGSPPNILNNTYLPTAADIAAGSVALVLSSTSKDDCNTATDTVKIFFKSPSVTSGPLGSVCSGTALNYTITSDFPTATFTWSRAAVTGISNPAVNNQTSNTITETLINTGTVPIVVNYVITPVSNGCPGAPVIYPVTVNPIPATPAAASNSPVCINTTINLQTPAVAGATYSWTGPNGFASPLQNPTVPATTDAAGTYSVTITVGGCESPAGSVNVVVDPLPTVDVGPDKTITICPSMTSVQLAGSVGGGAKGGIWTTSGTGTFTGGGNSTTVLAGQYFPSAQDVANGSVTLTLASISNDNCAIVTEPLTIDIHLLKAVTAGPDQTICSQNTARLTGQITIPGSGAWTTSGTGTFNPSATQMDTEYVPSADDIKNGSVVITLTAANPGDCYIPSDKLTITFAPPPTLSAGPTKYVLKGQTVTLEPTVSDPDVTYAWSPDIDISSTSVKNPVVTGNADQTYTLTVTDSRGCSATSSVKVIVSPPIVIPNAFTPNGDGVNDQWNIVGLSAYQQSTIDVFDRNGQKVFHSIGYGMPWDGTYSGKEVPYGVYYYIIDPKYNGLHVLSGSVTVVR